MARFNRILITGAAGALGKLARASLPPLTTHLRLSDREPLGDLANHEEGIIADVADADAMADLARDVDMIVHMGGQSIEGTWADVLNANIIGFYNVYEAARKAGVRRIVWASSNHAIGFYAREQVIDASVYPRPDSNYGVSKVFGEGIAQYYWDKFGLESVSIRIGSCFPEPRDRRMLATWLSPRDYQHLIERCLIAPRTAHTVIYGMSDNDMKLWDNRLATHIGFRPQDNAEAFRNKIEAATPEPEHDDIVFAAHGGGFAKAGHFDDKPS
ncbi:MAG: NAD(P)-dependent oxidoreductase [Pseudomonadota bacterium]